MCPLLMMIPSFPPSHDDFLGAGEGKGPNALFSHTWGRLPLSDSVTTNVGVEHR